MLWRGISIEPEWVVLALLLVAIAMGRGLSFVADWGPFLLLGLGALPELQPEPVRGVPVAPRVLPGSRRGLRVAAVSGAERRLDLVELRRLALDRVPRRALRRRCRRRLRLRGGRHAAGRGI